MGQDSLFTMPETPLYDEKVRKLAAERDRKVLLKMLYGNRRWIAVPNRELHTDDVNEHLAPDRGLAMFYFNQEQKEQADDV